MQVEKLEEILKIIDGMPKYEWDRIVHEVNKAYSHKTAKLQLDDHDIQEINEIIKRQKIVYPKIDNTKSKSLMDIASHDLKDI